VYCPSESVDVSAAVVIEESVYFPTQPFLAHVNETSDEQPDGQTGGQFARVNAK
jgi:hypothetical protein